jgi:RNA polymerase sigma-70 factor (sigma-E family)
MAFMDDRDAQFTRFVTSSLPGLTRLAWFLTGNQDLAADLVEDAYVKTYAAWRRVRAEGAMAYTRTVVANANIDRLRRRHGETLLPDGYDTPGRAVDAADGVAARDEMARLLAVLPRRQRQVVVLRYALDLSEQDTAAMLGISAGAVKSAASRGLAALRAQAGTPGQD